MRAKASDPDPVDTWPLQDARAHLSELVDAALAGRPQRLTRRGKDAVVVVSVEAYERLTAPRSDLVDFFQSSPLAEAVAEGEIGFERDPTPIRDVEL